MWLLNRSLRSVKGLAPPTVPTDFISPTDPVEMRSCCLAHPDILTLPPPMTFSAAYTDFPHRGHFSDSPNFAENLEGLLVVAARAGFGDLVGTVSRMKTVLGAQFENCASRDVPHPTVPLFSSSTIGIITGHVSAAEGDGCVKTLKTAPVGADGLACVSSDDFTSFL